MLTAPHTKERTGTMPNDPSYKPRTIHLVVKRTKTITGYMRVPTCYFTVLENAIRHIDKLNVEIAQANAKLGKSNGEFYSILHISEGEL